MVLYAKINNNNKLKAEWVTMVLTQTFISVFKDYNTFYSFPFLLNSIAFLMV